MFTNRCIPLCMCTPWKSKPSVRGTSEILPTGSAKLPTAHPQSSFFVLHHLGSVSRVHVFRMNWNANVNDKARFDHPFALEKRLVLNLTERGILHNHQIGAPAQLLELHTPGLGAQVRHWWNYQSLSALGSSCTRAMRCFVRPSSLVVQHVHHPVSENERSLPVLCVYTVLLYVF